jgi:hypothetical protein
MHGSRMPWVCCACLVAVMGMVWPGTGRAEVIDLAGTCHSQVTEYVNGLEARTESQSETFPGSVSALPLRTNVGMINQTSNDFTGAGLCYCLLKDPNLRTADAPDELNIDAATFSTGKGLNYGVGGVITEQRTIRFTTQQTGRLEGEEVEFKSTFTLRGLLIALAQRSGMDLTGLLARVEAQVVQTWPDDANQAAKTLLHVTYDLEGQADGSIALVVANDAKASDVNLAPDLGGIVPEFNTVKVALFRQLGLQYRYKATVGQETQLTATLRVVLASLPEGTGVGATFGMPGETLGRAIDTALGTTAAAGIITQVNTVIDTPLFPQIDRMVVPGSGTGSNGFLDFFTTLCGGLGAESLIATGLMLGWVGLNARRRVVL